jgi:hypothetical protein
VCHMMGFKLSTHPYMVCLLCDIIQLLHASYMRFTFIVLFLNKIIIISCSFIAVYKLI